SCRKASHAKALRREGKTQIFWATDIPVEIGARYGGDWRHGRETRATTTRGRETRATTGVVGEPQRRRGRREAGGELENAKCKVKIGRVAIGAIRGWRFRLAGC